MHAGRLLANYIRLLLTLFIFVAAIVVVANKTRWLKEVWEASASLKQRVPVIRFVDPKITSLDWKRGNETNCVTRTVNGLSVPICTYSVNDDIYVSSAVQGGGYFESNWVVDIIELLRKHSTTNSSAIFLDLGANIGIYSLAAVHAGYPVIAVEPNYQTMRHLATGVQYGNVPGDRIVLVHNAVTDTSGLTLPLLTDVKNRGDTRVVNKSCESQEWMHECRPGGNTIRTITMNDLLTIRLLSAQSTTHTRQRVVMKVDAQGSEIAIFNPVSCNHFFDDVDVMAIQVEWDMIRLMHLNSDTKQMANVNTMLTNLYSRNYTVFGMGGSGQITEQDWRKWPADVMFVKA